jgi:hypothetical protein
MSATPGQAGTDLARTLSRRCAGKAQGSGLGHAAEREGAECARRADVAGRQPCHGP